MENSKREYNLEILIFAVSFVIAVLLRFLRLGALPLGNYEAANALTALKIAEGTATTMNGQPIYTTLTSSLFFVLGKTGFWARFWPAIFGCALVFVPLLFRPWLGKIPTWGLAFFFAIEPGFTALSRTANGTMMGVVGLLAGLGFLLNRKPVLSGIAIGIFLLSGQAAWPGALAFLIAAAITILASRNESDKDSLHFVGDDLKLFTISCGAFLLFFGTLFFIRPFIITGLGTSVVDYFKTWTGRVLGIPLSATLIVLFSEQILAIVLALWGAVASRKSHARINFFLGLWALVSTLITLLNPGRQVVDWVWALIPLWTLAAFGLEALIPMITFKDWRLTSLQLLATVVLIVFSSYNLLGIVVDQSSIPGEQQNYLLITVLPLVLLVVITFLIGWGWAPDAAREGLILGIGFLLVSITFGSAWKAGGLGPRPEAEFWRSDPLPIGNNLVLKQLTDISTWNTGEKTGIEITLYAMNQPSLDWLTRNFDKVENTNIIGSTETPSIVISSPANSLSLPKTYRGQEVTWSASPDLSTMTAADWVTWFAFRDVPLNKYQVLIWARNDLFKGS